MPGALAPGLTSSWLFLLSAHALHNLRFDWLFSPCSLALGLAY